MEPSPAPESPPPHRHAPFALWRIAQGFLCLLYGMFGNPEDVAARQNLRRDAHALMAAWLSAGEMLMRRLLLIEAAAYPKPNVRPLLREKRDRVRKLIEFSASEPETWRVSFRCFSAVTHTQPQDWRSVRAVSAVGVCHRISRDARWARDYLEPMPVRSAWPLAERYEALIRVFNHPTRYAQRLARRLHVAPHRVGEVLFYPEESFERVGADDMAALAPAIAQARRRWDSS